MLQMILVASPAKPFDLTAKGTPRRHVVLDTYAQEIHEAYMAVEHSSQSHIPPPVNYELTETLRFARQAIAEVMIDTPQDDEDIFQHGCDR